MQQSNAGAALYDHHSGVGPADAGEAVMARWLQSAGLQHLASPLASAPNTLMQGYGSQSTEEKQKLYKLLRSLNLSGEFRSEACTPTTQGLGAPGAMDGFSSPELLGEIGAGLLDLHAVDDTDLLSEHVMSEPFELPQFIPSNGLDENFDAMTHKQQRGQMDSNIIASAGEKEMSTKENNVAKIKVVVH